MLVGMLVSDIRLAGDVGDGGYSPPSSAPSSNVAEHAVDSDGRGLEPFTAEQVLTPTARCPDIFHRILHDLMMSESHGRHFCFRTHCP